MAENDLRTTAVGAQVARSDDTLRTDAVGVQVARSDDRLRATFIGLQFVYLRELPVDEEIEAPEVETSKSGSTEPGKARLKWKAVPGAKRYEVNKNEEPFFNVGDVLEYVFEGLSPGQVISARVRTVKEIDDEERASPPSDPIDLEEGVPPGPAISGRTIRAAYFSLDEVARESSTIGGYARRIAEALGVETAGRGSGPWEKVVYKELDAEQTETIGSWRTRLLSYLKKQ